MDEFDREWQEWRDSPEYAALVYAYIKKHNPALLRVGVEFTPEQQANIRAMVEEGSKADAQKLILDELDAKFKTEG